MQQRRLIPLLFLISAAAAGGLLFRQSRVGTHTIGSTLVATGQIIVPAGTSVAFAGRPVDVTVSPDGELVYVKDNRGLVVIDAETWVVRQELAFPRGGGSMHGIAAYGSRVWLTTSQNDLWEADIEAGRARWSRSIALPGPNGQGAAHGCGIALSEDGKRAYVCLSRNNCLGIVDLVSGQLIRQIPVGVAPFDVVISRDELTAYVSNWGGRRAKAGDMTADSSGTDAVIDARGVASSGTVSFVDLTAAREVEQVATGLHPSDLVLDSLGARLYAANANSDTISVIDTDRKAVTVTIDVRPDPKLPFGSAPNALALSEDGETLFAANGGNNAVAVVALGPGGKVKGFIPAGWYPGALAVRGQRLYVANVKGLGSLGDAPAARGRHVKKFQGTVDRVELPVDTALKRLTEQVRSAGRIPQILRAHQRSAIGGKPVPVPAKLGGRSVFEHVIYIIKENRTYDQVFGDLPKGDGDPALCIYGRDITPNHHALAEKFVLLDNYYCNGVLSADGHSWATEGNVTDHLEKAFGGFSRSYTFGDDPLTYSSSGFIWDRVLAAGRTFRNYGEMDYAEPVPAGSTFTEIFRDYRDGTGKIRFTQKIGVENLRRYSSPDYPGWNMRIPDVLRADRFLKELKGFEKRGEFPNLTILYLPSDHTSGTTPGMPTPRAHVTDNDLALGRIVEAVSKSRFWPKTCIFVNEDDPQDGFDHVDGHRSLCLVISPYTRRGEVVSRFYNQTAVLHTIARILGLPPMNQMDALAPVMTECFTAKPDFGTYTCLASRVPLDEINPQATALRGGERALARQSAALDLAGFDRAEEDTLNRILWHSAKGLNAPYPAHLSGAHGNGLKAKRLRLAVPGQ